VELVKVTFTVIIEVYRSGAIKIASLKDSYNEDVDVIETVSPEEFIQDKLQVPAEFVLE
jgi:hypothetical protein